MPFLPETNLYEKRVSVQLSAALSLLYPSKVVYAWNVRKFTFNVMVAMLLLTHSSKYSSANTHTDTRVYTHGTLPRSSKPPLLLPPLGAHVTLAHIDSWMCAFWSSERMLHCAQFLPPHPPTSTAVPLSPSRRSRPRLQTLVQRAMQPPRRRLLLFPFFQFGWGAGSERATHSPTPFYFLAAFTPTLRTVSITLLLAPPPQVAGRRKNIYIYLFLRGLRLPLPPSRSYPVPPSLRNSTLRLHLRDSLCLSCFLSFSYSSCFFLLLTSIYHFLPRRGAARPRDRRRKRRQRKVRQTERTSGSVKAEG